MEAYEGYLIIMMYVVHILPSHSSNLCKQTKIGAFCSIISNVCVYIFQYFTQNTKEICTSIILVGCTLIQLNSAWVELQINTFCVDK